jgi:hypothetical protein
VGELYRGFPEEQSVLPHSQVLTQVFVVHLFSRRQYIRTEYIFNLFFLSKHCFISAPSDSRVVENAGVELGTFETFVLALELRYISSTCSGRELMSN